MINGVDWGLPECVFCGDPAEIKGVYCQVCAAYIDEAGKISPIRANQMLVGMSAAKLAGKRGADVTSFAIEAMQQLNAIQKDAVSRL